MHAIWTGSLSFGLVNIPIRLYSAVQERALSFHLFHKKDKSPIRYVKICEKEQKEVDLEEIIKGFEVTKGKFVYLEEEDFEKANIYKTNTMEITGFTELSQIDPLFFDKPYFLSPDKKSEKAFFLLTDALKTTEKVAIVRYVLKSHENLAIIRPLKNILIVQQLRYLDEMRSIEGIKGTNIKRSPKELNIAVKLIEELAVDFDPRNYKDSYVEDLKELIQKKAKGKKIRAKGKRLQKTKMSELEKKLKDSLKLKKKSA
ncbi:MAG: Ku protein [Chlamydiae bacterium CG10_big_fil_rev_8_21_14_0_10_35_9]|nr:MAG: Ku protein [Chlamydiae bacterium CG10_big_fil_rev_8_21_14_0_10_35_9]